MLNTRTHTGSGSADSPREDAMARSSSAPEDRIVAFGGKHEHKSEEPPHSAPINTKQRRPGSPSKTLTDAQKATIKRNIIEENKAFLMMVPRTQQSKSVSGTILNCPHEMLESCAVLLNELKQQNLGYNPDAFAHVKQISASTTHEKATTNTQSKIALNNARIIRAACIPYENHLGEEKASDSSDPMTKQAIHEQLSTTINRYLTKNPYEVIMLLGTYSDIPQEDGSYPSGIEEREYKAWQEYYGDAIPTNLRVRTIRCDQLATDSVFKDDYLYASEKLGSLLKDSNSAFASRFNAAVELDMQTFIKRRLKKMQAQQAETTPPDSLSSNDHRSATPAATSLTPLPPGPSTHAALMQIPPAKRQIKAAARVRRDTDGSQTVELEFSMDISGPSNGDHLKHLADHVTPFFNSALGGAGASNPGMWQSSTHAKQNPRSVSFAAHHRQLAPTRTRSNS